MRDDIQPGAMRDFLLEMWPDLRINPPIDEFMFDDWADEEEGGSANGRPEDQP